jgi:hypothetical protein
MLNERNLHRLTIPRSAFYHIEEEDEAYAVKAEYWAAHPVPEPKPWEQAEPGEVWALTGAGGFEQPWRRTEDERWAACVAKLILYSHPEGIIAGRRIWPEVSA